MAGWQEIGEGIRNQHSGNLTLNLGKNSSNAQRGPVFGYLGNEYSGKLKFNVGRNSSNARGSSSGINCFAPYAPQSLTPNCLQSWSEGNGNQQSENLKFNLGKNSSNASGSARVLLLILPQSSAPCSLRSQLKLTVMKHKLYNWNSLENKQWLNDTIWSQEYCAQSCFHAILFAHLSYFLYFCIHLPLTNMIFVPSRNFAGCYLSLLKMCFQWCLHNKGSFSTDWHSAWVSIMWSVRKVKRRTWGKLEEIWI